MFSFTGNMFLILVTTLLIIFAMGIISRMIKDRRKIKEGDVIESNPTQFDNYSAFRSNSKLVTSFNKNKLINRFGRTNNEEADSALVKIFNDAKNPWGITPTIFRGIRLLILVVGFSIASSSYVLFGTQKLSLYILIITGIAWWYPMYYYKAIGQERNDEWDKVYEFIWIIKNTSLLYDAKKVCLETRDYIRDHYPHQKEIIDGFNDFYEHWNEEEIPEYILKHYNFPIPKEIYTILFQMAVTGTSPEQNLNNLREFSINKHNGRIQKVLSGVPSKATLGTLPFLMLSVVLALLVPMVTGLMKLM